MLTGARSAILYATAMLAALAVLAGCHKAVPPDSVCSYEPLPPSKPVVSGQGEIEALASTDEYFVIRDATGKQITNAHVNATASLPAGDYQIALNNSTHAISVQPKMQTKCQAGALLVRGNTDEYYAVLDNAHQIASAHVGAALSLFPANYMVRLNNSESAAEVRAGATVELNSGTVNVNATTDEYYAVLDPANRQLASSHVGRALSLFAGAYSLRINNTDTRVNVRAGELTAVSAGTLTVHGTTDEYYSVLNSAGTQVGSTHLEKPLAFFPGTYNVNVNNTRMPATIHEAAITEIKTGSVLLQGTTDEYYTVLDSAGTQLGSAHLGRGLSFLPGNYQAKLNNARLPVEVEAGKAGEYQSGSLLVKASGSDYYAVLDMSGTQLASKQVNQPVSLPAGKYSVKFANNIRAASVTSGQSTVLSW